jgi:hypothetical protein
MLNVQVQMLLYAIIIYLVFRFLDFIKIISIPGRGNHGRMVVGITTMQSVPRFGNKKTKAPKQVAKIGYSHLVCLTREENLIFKS